MLTILLGKDTFAKHKKIQQELSQYRAEAQVFRVDDNLPDLKSLSGATLFGPEKLFIFQHCLAKLDHDILLNFLPTSTARVYLVEDTLDKRKSANQALLNAEQVTVENFPAPTGQEAVAWIVSHAQELGLSLNRDMASLVYRLLSPNEEELDVLTAHHELSKLYAYSGGEVLTQEAITELVNATVALDVFSLLDAVASKQKSKAIQMLETYFALSGGDEKAKAIQLTAMLADQMRNLLIAKDAEDQRMTESALMKLTGWKSGRVFVMKKLSAGMTSEKIKQTLSKLEKLDLEMKSGTLPQHVVLDVIVAGM